MKAKDAIGKKVAWTSPRTGRVYEGVVDERWAGGTLVLLLSKDYTAFDFRLEKGHPLSIGEDDEVRSEPSSGGT